MFYTLFWGDKMKSVFIVGDSISLFYHKYLKENLKDVAIYSRKGRDEEITTALTPGESLENIWKANGGNSNLVLEYFKTLESRFNFGGKANKQDVILFNCGLHDIKTRGTKRANQVGALKYAHNLKRIIKEFEKLKKAGLAETLIWINTTPVVDSLHNAKRTYNFRYNADVIKYNCIAEKIMNKYGIPIIDLYTFTKDVLANRDNCFRDELHYSDKVSLIQADFIKDKLQPYLK